jgi:O-antigen/teichoic acid export membrane protein
MSSASPEPATAASPALPSQRAELTRPTAIYFIANALSGGIALFLLPVLTRVLSPSDFGLVALFATVQTFLFPVVGLSTSGFITRQYFDQRQAMPTYLTTCLAIMVASSGCVVVAFWFSRAALADVTGLPVPWLFVSILAAAAQFTFMVGLSFWQASGRAVRVSTFLIFQSVIIAGLSLLLVIWAQLGWQGRTTGQVVGLSLAAALGLLLLGNERCLGFPGIAQARAALAFGLPLVPHGLAGATLAVADRLLLANLMSFEHVGLYAAARQIAMGLALVIQAFNRAYTPWLYGELSAADAPERGRRVVRVSYGYFLALASLAFVVGIASPWIALVLGDTFRASAVLLPYLAAGVVMTGMYNVLAGYLMFTRRTGELSGITIFSALLSVAATILLVRSNGMIGAAQAFMLTQAALFLMTWWRAQRAHPMPWSPVNLWSASSRR